VLKGFTRSDVVEKIRLGKEYKIPEWLVSGYSCVIQLRVWPLDAMSADFGWEVAAKLLELRMKLWEGFPRLKIVLPACNTKGCSHKATFDYFPKPGSDGKAQKLSATCEAKAGHTVKMEIKATKLPLSAEGLGDAIRASFKEEFDSMV
jgi:hypothetical protein